MLLTGLKDGTIKIYDIRSHQEIFKIADYKGDLSSLAFSNKGLNFAAAWKTSDVCRVFNLRKLGKEVYEIQHSAGPINSVAFDHYGGYLLTGAGNTMNIFASKKWDEPPVYANGHPQDNGVVNVAKFAKSGRMVVSGGNEDRFMKIFAI